MLSIVKVVVVPCAVFLSAGCGALAPTSVADAGDAGVASDSSDAALQVGADAAKADGGAPGG